MNASRMFFVMFAINPLSIGIGLGGHYCDKYFGNKVALQRQITNVHEGITNYSCDFKGRSFGHEGSLQEHITTVHQGIKIFLATFAINHVGIGLALGGTLLHFIKIFVVNKHLDACTDKVNANMRTQ